MKKINERLSNISIPVKASIAYVICNLIQKGIQFITVPIFARILLPDEYGQFTLYQSWLTLITVLATLNLSAGVFNNGMVSYPRDRDQYTSSIQGLSSLISSFFILLYLLFSDKWAAFLGLPKIVITFMMLEIFFTPAFGFWTARQKYEYKYKTLVIVTICIAVIQPVIGLFCVEHSSHPGSARVLSVCMINILVGLIFYIYNFYKGKQFYKKNYWIFALKFSIPLIPHHLSGSILSQSDRIMISRFFDDGKAAIYGVTYQAGMVMNLVTRAVMGALTPWVYDNMKEQKYKKVFTTFEKLWMGMGFIVMIPILFAPEVIYILGGDAYKEGMFIVSPIAVSEYCSFVCCTFSAILYYFAKTGYIMISTLFTASVNLLLNFFMIPWCGYVIAAYTTLFSYLIYIYIYFTFVRKVLRENNIEFTLINVKYLIIITFLIIVLSELIKLIYKFMWIRILLMICIAFFLSIILKKEFRNIKL